MSLWATTPTGGVLVHNNDVLGSEVLLDFLHLPQWRVRLHRVGLLAGIRQDRVVCLRFLQKHRFGEAGAGEDAQQAVLGVRDHQTADAAFAHQGQGVAQPCVGAASDGPAHDAAHRLCQNAAVDVPQRAAGAQFVGNDAVQAV